jgi:hypothetical protein
MNIGAAWVIGLIATVIVLAIVGAGFWGWVLGLIFLPILGAVLIGMFTS